MKTLLLTLLRGATMIVATTLVTSLALLMAAGWMLKAQPDEWSMPLRVGTPEFGVRIEAGVASLLRVSTNPVGILLLDGRSLTTPYGTLHFSRLDDERFAIDCRPCRLQVPAFGDEPLALAAVRITGTQRADTLHGTIEAGRLAGRYTGRFDTRTMKLDIRLDPAPIAAYYRVFGANVPEVGFADIAGTASLAVKIELPSARVSIRPTIEGFAVSGLGTERLAGRLPAVSCAGGTGTRRTRKAATDLGFWLPRAVIAAEDQRYYEHPGYDLDELLTSIDRNQAVARVERGASTIPQQLAKLLQVGSERTVSRKLRELLYATEMEQTLGKARMLQLYLAVVPWGEGTCGAEAAAMHYFDVQPAKLSGAQAVWLAAMLHAPDREAAQWASAGRIDLPRATWIAKGLQRIRADARMRVLDELATMAPGAEPPGIVASSRDGY